MSGLLLSSDDFARAREAVRGGGFTDELYGFLTRLVTVAQATRAMAPAPVPGGRWSDPDAVGETVQAWLAEELLDGGLLKAFDACQTPRALARYLERALRNWLVGRSRRASGPRLLERAVEMLRDDDGPFSLLRDARAAAERWWGLAAWEHPDFFDGNDSQLIAQIWALGDFTLLRFSSSERADPVLSSEELHRYLLELLGRIGQGLSGRHLDTGFRARFAFAYDQAPAPLEDAPEPRGASDAVVDVLVDEAAHIALADLSQRQLQVLLERPRGTLEELAGRLQVSRGTVDNEYRRALLKVRAAAPSEPTFDAVLEKVLELASEEENA
jgi:DNA-binding CsgD family transcriptional regulator